jgi:PAS domain S-box-containing protein
MNERKAHATRAPDLERRLQLIIDSMRDYALFMLDPAGRIETWGAGAEQAYGYTAREILGETLATFHTPEDRAARNPETLVAEARATGRAQTEGWRVRKDGSRFWADVAIAALREGDGELVGFVVISRDQTERREAEEQRVHEEQRFRVLVETAQDYAIFMLDTAGRVATWNEGAQRIKGYAADEIVGQHFSKFYPGEDLLNGKCDRELEIALRDGRFEDEDWRVRKDGSLFWANVVLAPLRDRTGKHIGFSKITRDLTERRTAERDRLALAHAQEALRLRDEFLSIASHELRTPLVALQLQLDSLRSQSTNLDPKQISKVKVDRASRNVQRLADLIATLLDVSRIAQGRLTLAPRPFELGSLANEVIDRLDESAQEARCIVVPDLAGDIEGTWDPLRIGQVISNLLSNAFKYASGSRIDVRLVRETDEAVLYIEDRGPGIPDDQRERIFDRFERAASRNFGGMGLGLYVAREIVLAHGGTIAARNRDGGGATLEVRLPIRDSRSLHATKDPQ